MRYAVIDLEATCWEAPRAVDEMEIIEFGAVMLEGASGPAIADFARLVKPTREPVLSDFCQQLTGITQAEVETAADFGVVLQEFEAWLGSRPAVMCSWGAYDFKQLDAECKRHQVSFPPLLSSYVNLKRAFARRMGIRPCGMRRALQLAGIPFAGHHHRALDDARNIARIACLMLPVIEGWGVEAGPRTSI